MNRYSYQMELTHLNAPHAEFRKCELCRRKPTINPISVAADFEKAILSWSSLKEAG